MYHPVNMYSKSETKMEERCSLKRDQRFEWQLDMDISVHGKHLLTTLCRFLNHVKCTPNNQDVNVQHYSSSL